jgi:hypothetical protein
MMDDKVSSAGAHVETDNERKTHTSEKAMTDGANLSGVMQMSKPDPWSAGYLRLYGMCLLIYLCSTMNGMSRPNAR